MISQEAQQLQFHLQAIASILYRNNPSRESTSVEVIEKALRRKMLENASPQVAAFLSMSSPELNRVNNDEVVNQGEVELLEQRG